MTEKKTTGKSIEEAVAEQENKNPNVPHLSYNPVITALVAAKGNFGSIEKDAYNPFHKSKYSSLKAINDAVDSALLEQGLTVIQGLDIVDGRVYLVAKLVHVSGHYDPRIQESTYELPPTKKPQEMGSAMTYGRRYNKCALLDIVADSDDDGNASTTISGPQFNRLIAIAKKNKWDNEDVKQIIKDHGFESGQDLTLTAYQDICGILESKTNNTKEKK